MELSVCIRRADAARLIAWLLHPAGTFRSGRLTVEVVNGDRLNMHISAWRGEITKLPASS